LPVAARTRSRTGGFRRVNKPRGRVRVKRSPRDRSWVWVSELRKGAHPTCPICWYMHGSVHPWTESLNSHINCGCSQARKWGRPYVPGAERFDRLTAEQQERILGPTKYDAFRRGEITLADMVVVTHHPEHGIGRRLKTLGELGLR
jgi:hypothetical protein